MRIHYFIHLLDEKGLINNTIKSTVNSAINSTMNQITANELKTRGVSIVEERLADEEELFISVRGRKKFVVLSVEKYARLREQELDMAIAEARADYEAGRVVSESVDDHMRRVTGGV